MDRGVHSVCFCGDFTIKTVVGFLHWNLFENMTRSSILFICNTFCCRLILLSSLYIELALVCCTNPDNVHCFGTIFPNLNFVFASICAARPEHFQSDQYRSCSTVNNMTTPRGRRTVPGVLLQAFIPMGSNQKQLWVREITWYLYTRGVGRRMEAKQRWFKVTRQQSPGGHKNCTPESTLGICQQHPTRWPGQWKQEVLLELHQGTEAGQCWSITPT